jgi:carboxyl-terminal processing protease
MKIQKISKFLTVATLVVQGVFSVAFASEDGPWTEAEMTMKFYRSFINEKNCGTSLRNYLACITSIEKLLNSIDKSLSLETQTTAEDSKGQVVFDSNNLKVVKNSLTRTTPKTIGSRKEIYESIKSSHENFKNKFSPAYFHYKNSDVLTTNNILAFIEVKYSDKLDKNAIAGALNEYIHVSRDPHSDYRLKEERKKGEKDEAKNYSGIGAQISSVPKGILIDSLFEGSGALEAGVEVGDIITSIEEHSAAGMSTDDAVKILLGEPNTKVKLTLLREMTSFVKVITRKKLSLKIVSSDHFDLFGNKIGYIKYANFTYEDGCKKIAKALVEFNEIDANGAILDLRDNGGGSVSIAACIVSLFMGPGIPVAYFERSMNGSSEINLTITRYLQIFDKPLVILINANSASASELISGTMRETNRALIVGQRSFGKGSAQSPDENDEKDESKSMTLWKTSGLFFQPSGKTNQLVGIIPHLEVFKDLLPSEKETYAIREQDIFLYPLEPKRLSVPYETSGLDKLEVSKECIESKNPAKHYSSMGKNNKLKDFQLLTAAAAIGCYK